MAGPLLYPPSVNNLQKQLNANYTAADGTITLNNTTNLQNKPGVCLINRIDVNDTIQSTTDWTFIKYTGISGSTLTGCTPVSNDQDHATGEVVEFVPDVTWAQALSDALANLVDTTTLAVDTTKVVTPGGTQTLTNKTLTSPTISGPTITGTATIPTTQGSSGGATFGKFIGLKDHGTVGATETCSGADGDRHLLTLDENVTITLSNMSAGQTMTLYLLQDGTGTNTITWADTITWQDGITWGTSYYTTTANKMTTVIISYVNSAYFGMVSKFA